MSTSAFAGLVDDLKGVSADTETMAKSIEDKGGAVEGGADEDDKEIAEAAAAADADKDKGDADKGDGMAKSFQITLEDGTVIDAVDGADMIKSLVERVERNEGETKAVLESAVGVIKEQGALIKSLADQVKGLAGSPVRRKAVLAITEKPGAVADLAKSDTSAGTISSDELMAKSLGAQVAGRVTSLQIAVAEQQIQRGEQPDPAFVRAVIGV